MSAVWHLFDAPCKSIMQNQKLQAKERRVQYYEMQIKTEDIIRIWPENRNLIEHSSQKIKLQGLNWSWEFINVLESHLGFTKIIDKFYHGMHLVAKAKRTFGNECHSSAPAKHQLIQVPKQELFLVRCRCLHIHWTMDTCCLILGLPDNNNGKQVLKQLELKIRWICKKKNYLIQLDELPL